MWVQAGFPPDTLWGQTPLHFQCAMEGVRKRLEAEHESRTALAYETGAFGALGYHGKLKPFRHYARKSRQQDAQEMLSMLKSMGANSNMKVTRVKLAAVND